eukprot:8561663-Pyramimonas_sp.AAC.1
MPSRRNGQRHCFRFARCKFRHWAGGARDGRGLRRVAPSSTRFGGGRSHAVPVAPRPSDWSGAVDGLRAAAAGLGSGASSSLR